MYIQPCHIQNSGLFRTGGIFKSLSNIYDEQAYSQPWHSQNNLFNHFQRYLSIFRDIDAYSATLTGVQPGRKKFPDFREALIAFLMNCLWKWPSSSNSYSCPEKFLVVHLHSGIILFAKRVMLYVWQCSEYVSLSNCSVNSVTLYYVLH